MWKILLSSIFYSLENIFAKIAVETEHWSSTQLIIKRYAYFGLVVILYVLSQNGTVIRDFKNPSRLKYPILIGLASLFGGLFLYQSFATQGLAVAVPAVNGASVLITTLFGFFILKESVTYRKITGVIFLIVGLLLL